MNADKRGCCGVNGRARPAPKEPAQNGARRALCGIKVEGLVLEGRMTIKQAMLTSTMPQQTYRSVAEYDSVMRAHCRLSSNPAQNGCRGRVPEPCEGRGTLCAVASLRVLRALRHETEDNAPSRACRTPG
jgi:hypothetical protein